MLYTATITTAALRLRETRVIAALLLTEPTPNQWREAIITRNILQLGSVHSITRISRLLRARLTPLGPTLWHMVANGDADQARQAALAGCIQNSRLLGDFMDIALREQRTLFAPQLAPHVWRDYIAGCRGRDPDMPHYSDATENKLRSVVYSILTGAGYLSDTRSLRLQNVFVDAQLAAYLTDRRETYILRCIQATQ